MNNVSKTEPSLRQVEVTQFSTIEYRNVVWENIKPDTDSLREQAMLKFDVLVKDPESKLNKELNGLDNIRTVRVMQHPENRGAGKTFELVFALKKQEAEIAAERRVKQEAERKAKELNEAKERALKQGRCVTHPFFFGKGVPSTGCDKCVALFNQREKAMAKKSTSSKKSVKVTKNTRKPAGKKPARRTTTTKTA